MGIQWCLWVFVGTKPRSAIPDLIRIKVPKWSGKVRIWVPRSRKFYLKYSRLIVKYFEAQVRILWFYLGLPWSTWVYLGPPVSTLVYLCLLGSTWAYHCLSGSNWVYVGLLGSTWVSLGLPGSTWAYLGLPGSTWNNLGLFGSNLLFFFSF